MPNDGRLFPNMEEVKAVLVKPPFSGYHSKNAGGGQGLEHNKFGFGAVNYVFSSVEPPLSDCPLYAHKLLNKGSDNSTSTEPHTTLRSSPGFAWETTVGASIDARWKTANAVVNLYCGACGMFSSSESEKRRKCAREYLPSVEGAHGTMKAVIYHLIPSNVSKRGAPAFHTMDSHKFMYKKRRRKPAFGPSYRHGLNIARKDQENPESALQPRTCIFELQWRGATVIEIVGNVHQE
ncbi:hypothetical protein B0H11DRAFT_1898743 [Mycena galericulata]|nr:hypothetical protein B0H11DRAFT_1898743 [Mycena galericulata]